MGWERKGAKVKPFFVVNLSDVIAWGLALLCVICAAGWVTLGAIRNWWRRRDKR